MFRTNSAIIDMRITNVLLPGFISDVVKINKTSKKNADTATHAGTISIIMFLKLTMFPVIMVGENSDRAALTARTVNGVRISLKKYRFAPMITNAMYLRNSPMIFVDCLFI